MLHQISEQTKKEYSISFGIDLGTTNSVMSYIDQEKRTQFIRTKPVIYDVYKDSFEVMEDESESIIFPSTFTIISDSKIAIGLPHQKSDVKSIKRLMGLDKNSFNKLHNLSDLNLDISFDSDDELQILVGRHKYSSVNLSSFIIKALCFLAKISLNIDLTEELNVVITVPAYFEDSARCDTIKASKLSYVNLLKIISEPTAASLSTDAQKLNDEKYLLFYDLGGGTFDSSIIYKKDNIYKVIATKGDLLLGGDNIDFAILEFLQQKGVKATLSYATDIKINYKNDGDFNIQESEFNNIISPFLDKTINIVKKLLIDANLKKSQIENVILVGGSTKLNLLQTKLKEYFGDEKIVTTIDPDLSVAAGAAICSYNLMNNNNNLLDVCPLSLGIELYGGLVDKIIERNSQIPITKSKIFTTYVDNQQGMQFKILQGDRDLSKDMRTIGFFEITNLPMKEKGKVQVELSFALDSNCILTVSATELSSKIYKEIEINSYKNFDKTTIEQELISVKNNIEQDFYAKNFTEVALEIRLFLDNLRPIMNHMQMTDRISNSIGILKILSKEEHMNSIKDYKSELEIVNYNYNIIKTELIPDLENIINNQLKENLAGKKVV
jgi:molecular chaperone HscA